MVNDNIIGRQRPDGYGSWNSAMDQAAGVAPAEFAAYTCNEEIVERFARSLGGENIRPSMLIAPSRLGSGVLRAQIPDNLAFTVTNGTSPNVNGSTRVGPNGLIETAKTNLALQSAGFQDLAVWSRANISVTTGFTALDGSTDADLLTATSSGSARIVQSFSFVSGTTYTYSTFAKAGSGFFGLTMEEGFVSSGAAVIWNLNTGALAVSGVVGSGYTLVSQGIENYGNGWYRCRMTVLMSVSVAGNIRANTSNGTMISAVIQSDNGNSVYVWGAQFEVGSSASEYIPTTTVARTRFAGVDVNSNVNTNAPRLDYLGQSCPGLLVEPSAQNLCQRSEEFNNAFHFPFNLNAFGSGSVANTTATLDPYGTNVADYIQENSVSGAAHSIIDVFAGNVSGTTYTWSVFAKAAERTIINLFNNGGGGGSATFNLTTGVATLIAGVSASMQNYGNGWWRCILTYTSTTTGNHNVQIRLCDASGNVTYNGTGNQGAYIFGAQLETGSIATTYIPTTAAAVSRAADVISASGVSGLIGQTEGTIYAEVDVRILGDGRFASVSDGTNNNRIQCRFNTGNNGVDFVVVVSGAVVGFSISNSTHPSFPATIPAGTYKIALAYKQNDYVVAMNGTTYTPLVTSRNVPLNFSKVTIGADVGDLNQFNNRIRAAALYTTRLSNEQLMLLTSPTYYGDIADMSWAYYLNRSGESVPSCLQTRNYQLLQV